MRRPATTIATVGLVLLAAACGASPSSMGPGGVTYAAGPTSSQAASSGPLAFARCMRSHGVPNFPNPNRSGYFPKATIARIVARNPHYQAAYRVCGHLLPNGSQQAASSGPLAFARCMRAHGVPNFPNPNRNGYFPKARVYRIAANNPHYQAAYRACGHLLPNGGS
jgi:hypothetical protein